MENWEFTSDEHCLNSKREGNDSIPPLVPYPFSTSLSSLSLSSFSSHSTKWVSVENSQQFSFEALVHHLHYLVIWRGLDTGEHSVRLDTKELWQLTVIANLISMLGAPDWLTDLMNIVCMLSAIVAHCFICLKETVKKNTQKKTVEPAI